MKLNREYNYNEKKWKCYSEEYQNLVNIERDVAIGLRSPSDLIDITKTTFLSLDGDEKKDMLERIFYNKYCSNELKSDIKKIVNNEDISGRANGLKVLKLYEEPIFKDFLNPESDIYDEYERD